MLKGIGASPGFGIGTAVIIEDVNLDYAAVKYSDAETEKQRLADAVEAFTLETQEMVQNLLSMTPHVWRISREGANALSQVSRLSDRAEVVFNVYGRQTR